MPFLPAFLLVLLAAILPGVLRADDFAEKKQTARPEAAGARAAKTTPVTVYAVRLDGPVGKPSLFILRRALKEAIDTGVDVFLLDLNTPGGEMGAMMETMEALANFPGKTVTYINHEALSAGSYIASVTDEIWFAPKGIMGAADVVSGTGEDVGDTLKLKLHSYIDAKVRVLSADKGRYRDRVQRAMMDADYELKIGDTMIKPAGELLSLTAAEAGAVYGEPPVPLLSSGTAETLDDVLRTVAGASFSVKHFERNWAESLALLIQWAAPVLLALAGLCVLIEYKTPGFGFFGISAAVLFFIVFAGNYAAGLAGYEPLIFLLLGVVLIIVEMVFFPGVYIALSLGVASLLFGLVWSMLDVWPRQDLAFTPELLLAPFVQLAFAALIFAGGAAALWRFLPRSVLRNRLVLETAVETEAASPARGADFFGGNGAAVALPVAGDTGVAVTDLRLSGVVEVGGTRYNATSRVEMIGRGARVVVRTVRPDGLIVESAP